MDTKMLQEMLEEKLISLVYVRADHDKLCKFFQEEWPEQIKEGSACDNAVRLLREYKDRINGAKDR